MGRRVAALILVFSLLSAGSAIAGPFEDASEAYARGEYETAYRLFKPLAEQGLPDAQYKLAVMYDLGLGVPQNHTEAFKWYGKAADLGHADAQNNLGIMYETGLGVPRDYVQALVWFHLATSRFPASEQEKREVAENHRGRITSNMTPDQIAEAQRIASEWKPKMERK